MLEGGGMGVGEAMMVDAWTKRAVGAERKVWDEPIINMEGVMLVWLLAIVGSVVLTVVGVIMSRKVNPTSSEYTIRYATWFKS
jgi:hypothetical protein